MKLRRCDFFKTKMFAELKITNKKNYEMRSDRRVDTIRLPSLSSRCKMCVFIILYFFPFESHTQYMPKRSKYYPNPVDRWREKERILYIQAWKCYTVYYFTENCVSVVMIQWRRSEYLTCLIHTMFVAITFTHYVRYSHNIHLMCPWTWK
jgi:hypothetical protein